jgi:hypothetical protein
VSAHLHNAARELQRILARRDPQHVFVVEVIEPRTVAQHAHTVSERYTRTPPTGPFDHDRAEERAK